LGFKLRFDSTAKERTFTNRFGFPTSRNASSKLRVAKAEFINAPANDFSIPAARWMITETSCVAFRQSSRESRSPETNSTVLAFECWLRIFLRFSSLPEGRTKQRRLLKP